MNILISQSSSVPIYEQIEDQIRQEILSGNLSAGEMLPSIRKIAKELGVGIITIKRAYEDLCQEGLLSSIPGKGVFVSEVDTVAAKEIRLQQLREHLGKIKIFCESSDIQKEEVLNEINKMWSNDNE